MTTSVLARLGTVCFGCILTLWAVLVCPGFWRAADAERIAAGVVQGRQFQTDFVAQAAADAGTPDALGRCHPAASRAAAILRLYLYEQALAAQPADKATEPLDALRDSLRSALHCVPSDGYLWLVLFSVENAEGRTVSELSGELLASYQLAPHEGWVALKRNPIVLAAFPTLTPDLQRLALDEFAELVQNELYEETARIYARAGPQARDWLLARLATVPLVHRERFAKAVQAAVPGTQVPGVDRSDDQPWKH